MSIPSDSRFSNRVTIAFIALCLGIVPCRPASAQASAPDDTPATTTIDALQRAMVALDKREPAPLLSASRLATQLDRDPAKLLNWVGQETAWVPYHGSLRGGEGVLLDRAGNSLDRALLLAELLQNAGLKPRLAHRQLSDAEATQLLRKAAGQGAKRPSSAPSADPAPADLTQYAKDMGVDAQALQRAAAAAALGVQRRTEDAVGRVAEQSDALLSAVSADLSTGPANDPATLAAARDHWWVQYQDKQAWVDLDPLAEQPFKAESTLDLANGKLPEKSPLHQELKIRVLSERWADSKPKESVVLSASIIPADVLGKRIMLANCPARLPGSAEAEKDGQRRVRRIATEAERWFPSLSVGGKLIVQKGFTTTGQVVEKPSLDPVQNLAGAAGGLMGGLGGLGGDDTPDEGILSAVWIEYEMPAPDGKPRIIRRELFDLIGPAARAAGKPAKPVVDDARKLERGLALLDRVEIMPLPCALPDAFVDNRMNAELAAGLKALLARAHQGEFKTREEMAGPVIDMFLSLQGPLYNWARARDRWSACPGQLAPTAINLADYRLHIVAGADQKLEMRQMMDIVTNDVAVIGKSGADARKAILAQGVSDTVAECFAFGEAAQPLNTSQLMALSTPQRITWSIVRDAADPSLKQLPPDVLARTQRDLAAGNVLLLPQKPIVLAEQPHLGWWRIDPRTGQSIGVIESGLNGTVEDLIVRINAIAVATGNNILVSGSTGLAAFRAMSLLGFMQYMGLDPNNAYHCCAAFQIFTALGGK